MSENALVGCIVCEGCFNGNNSKSEVRMHEKKTEEIHMHNRRMDMADAESDRRSVVLFDSVLCGDLLFRIG